MTESLRVVLWAMLFTICPLWTGLAATMAHPELDKPVSVWLVYGVALATGVMAVRAWVVNPALPKWREELLVLAVLFALHVYFFGPLHRQFLALHERLVEQPQVPRVTLGIKAPAAAPPFTPDGTLGAVGDLLRGIASTLFCWLASLVIGTPLWCWIAFGGTAWWLKRKG